MADTLDKIKSWYQRSRKAVTAFLVPVVPAVGIVVAEGEVTRTSVWLVVVAVLAGLGVYARKNDPSA